MSFLCPSRELALEEAKQDRSVYAVRLWGIHLHPKTHSSQNTSVLQAASLGELRKSNLGRKTGRRPALHTEHCWCSGHVGNRERLLFLTLPWGNFASKRSSALKFQASISLLSVHPNIFVRDLGFWMPQQIELCPTRSSYCVPGQCCAQPTHYVPTVFLRLVPSEIKSAQNSIEFCKCGHNWVYSHAMLLLFHKLHIFQPSG